MADNADTPFFLIWKQPKIAVRKVLNTNPQHLTFPFAFVNALDFLFYQANQESLGLFLHYGIIVLSCLLLAVFYAFFWLYILGFLLFLITKLCFQGKAPFAHIRSALAWSSAPQLISLSVWLALLVFSPDYAFVRMVTLPSSIFLGFIMIVPKIWSEVLLIMNLQEAAEYSLSRAIGSWAIFFTLSLVVSFFFVRLGSYTLTFMS